MYWQANSACARQSTTSWNSGCSRSFVTTRTVVTLVPDEVVRNSGFATNRPTRITLLTARSRLGFACVLSVGPSGVWALLAIGCTSVVLIDASVGAGRRRAE